MKAQGPPPRSDFCNVYSSKEHADTAGGGSYYDGETGTIHFASRVKDPHGVKENLPFDVSGIREELNDVDFAVCGTRKLFTPSGKSSSIPSIPSICAKFGDVYKKVSSDTGEKRNQLVHECS